MYAFVYGTLKAGRGNDYLLKGARLMGNAASLDKFVMTNCGFPYLIRAEYAPGLEANHILGELYEIDEDILQSLDWLEGFLEDGNEGNHYNRELTPVKTEDGVTYDTFVYICNSQEDSTEHELPLCDTKEFMDRKVYVY